MAELISPDLCIIGGGPAGLAVAERALALGASVVIVDKAGLGGNALRTGAVPALALGAAASHAHAMRNGQAFGIASDEIRVNFRRVHDHVEQVMAALAPGRAEPRFEALGARVLRAEAKFLNPRTLAAGEVHVRARRFVIATGARPQVPEIAGLGSVPFFTLDTILDNTRKLSHLVIVGGGPVGLVIGQAYARLGSQVTVIEAGALLPGIDPELAEVALRQLREEGVALRANAKVAEIQARSMGIGVLVRSQEGEALLDASHILVAAPLVPNLEHLDLRKGGIATERADPTRLELSAGLRTSNPRVYAAGDVTATAGSVEAARQQAERVVRQALLNPLPWPARQPPLARIVHTDPAIAEIGLTEAEARAKLKSNFRVNRVAYADNDLARASRRTYGLAKVITDRSGRLLGAAVVGSGAGELAALFGLAIANGMTARQLGSFVAPYGSFAEIANRLAEADEAAAPHPVRRALQSLGRLRR